MRLSNAMKRYYALSYSGKILTTGKRLCDVQNMGKRIIVDYKLERYCIQDMYPVARPFWIHNLNVGDTIRKLS